MYDSVSPSDGSPQSALGPVRADSVVRVALSSEGGRTHAARVYEQGSFRVRFPRGRTCETVLLNTGGGMTGGDRLTLAIGVASGASATFTSQAAEKIYKSDGPDVAIDTRLTLARGSSLCWLPQETILFDRARLLRTLSVDLDPQSQFTALEIIVAGRIAHGETLTNAAWRDVWRIRRDGRLIFADNAGIDGAITSALDQPAVGDGARALATLVHIAPDAEARLDEVRAALDGAAVRCAASAYGGMLVARFAGARSDLVRAACASAVTSISKSPMPRAWSC